METIFTDKDEQLIRGEFEGLRIASLKRCANQHQYELVLKAFDFANKAHYNVRRRSGEPYIIHPIAVAKIVVQEIGLGCKSICAALLHDVVEDTDYTTEDISKLFGDKIASLVDGLTKIKSALAGDSMKNSGSMQAENFKRILLTLNDDARIVLIKLADRLHNVRTIAFMPEYKREKILSETMYIFIPLAHRLGLYNIKSEMENIWMQFNEPHEFVRIQGILDGIVADKSDNINRLVRELGQITEKAGIKARILKRLKTPYSIWRKMERQNVPFEEIFDIYAVRIIFEPKEGVSERELCWSIFSQITERYKYNPARVRDWVSEPKVNGYESLHLTVMFLGIWIEVQIRSERMNSIAERGLAAHWAYKDGSSAGSPDADMDRWLKYVQDILENPDANALQFLDNIHKELLTSEIFVFTPTGESRSLPKGATALDFAFYIHSQIGRHAIAAKVNMKLVTLSTVLSNGDQVEIITSDSALPKREWLDFLSTSKARSCLVSALSETGQNNVRKGRELLTEQLAMRGIRVHTRVMRKLLDYYKIGGGKDELYTKIAIGLIDLADLDTVLKTNARERDVQMWGFKLLTPVSQGKVDKKQQFLLSENVDAGTISFRTSDCCHPIPGDTVMGVIGADGIVTIHKTTCQNYINIASTQGGSLVAVRWSRQFVMSFLARIAIGGIDRIGVLGDISDKISNLLSINIRKISIEAHDEIFEGYIDLYVHDRSALDNVIKALSEIKGMEKVNRIEID